MFRKDVATTWNLSLTMHQFFEHIFAEEKLALLVITLILCLRLSTLQHVRIHQSGGANLRENSGHQHPS